MKNLCLVYGEEKALQPVALNEAIQLAARIPPAAIGSIEVRPIRPIRELPQQAGQQQQ